MELIITSRDQSTTITFSENNYGDVDLISFNIAIENNNFKGKGRFTLLDQKNIINDLSKIHHNLNGSLRLTDIHDDTHLTIILNSNGHGTISGKIDDYEGKFALTFTCDIDQTHVGYLLKLLKELTREQELKKTA